MTAPIYYAIGDIHGEAAKLRALHSRITRSHNADYLGQPAQLIFLGDYVDRGPDSYDVMQWLMKMALTATLSPIYLKGNHEQMMLDAYKESTSRHYGFWLNSGGQQTLESYRAHGFNEPPEKHLAWLRTLPTYHWDKTAKLIFVHAGIDPTKFPQDGAHRHMWTRSRDFFETETWQSNLPEGTKVIHGHTPTKSGTPDVVGNFQRVNVDTGACYGGELTAVILAPSETPRFLTS